MVRKTVFLICTFLSSTYSIAVTTDATELVRKSDALMRRSQSYAKFTLKIKRPTWERTLTLEAWTRGTKEAFIRTLAPAKDRGSTFLKKGREAWQYIPSVDRVIKIPPSMMLQSWMGSDFTNDDVVRADSIVVDYTHKILDEPVENGMRYWLVEALPKPNAPVVWGKIILKIRQTDDVIDTVQYFDEETKLVKVYRTSDIVVVEGLHFPRTAEMQDQSKAGQTTSIHYDTITFSPQLSAQTFSERNLKR